MVQFLAPETDIMGERNFMQADINTACILPVPDDGVGDVVAVELVRTTLKSWI
jgi:hypothetical protein